MKVSNDTILNHPALERSSGFSSASFRRVAHSRAFRSRTRESVARIIKGGRRTGHISRILVRPQVSVHHRRESSNGGGPRLFHLDTPTPARGLPFNIH